MTPSQQTGNFGPSLNQRTLPSIARNDQLARIIMQAIRVALPGIVQAFDPGPPATVDVLITTNEYVQTMLDSSPGFETTDALGNPEFVKNPNAGKFIPVTRSMPLPLLTKIPLAFYTGGGWSLTLPIQQGDEVLVVFTDNDPSVWWQNGGAGNNPTTTEQKHGLSNAVALLSFRSAPRGLANYSTDSAQLRSDDGNTVIDLKSGQVTVTAAKVTVQSSDTVQINGASQVNLDAGSGTVNIGGGNVVIGPSTEIDGHQFLLHTHSGVSTGGGTSGPVT